ncbi:hypothetical protein [Antarctobacter heliothermus]|uniref:Uncharacterized protein n=1 Tax=Antarctobacter heliothermus TaxID=74033 RepID=A0A239DUI6_9RHOB|nr:hypothetical protein [Antarctobacter heliothermus]SNS36140.1 hypothetical protein SAMN04488078_101237 [Antarctobacter heliothermus]
MIDPVAYLPDLWRAPDPARRIFANARGRVFPEKRRAGVCFR